MVKSYKELFDDIFKRSQEIDDKFADLMNTEGLKSGVSYLKEIGATKLYMNNYHIKYRISEWTKDTLSSREKMIFLNELKILKDYIIDIYIEKMLILIYQLSL